MQILISLKYAEIKKIRFVTIIIIVVQRAKLWSMVSIHFLFCLRLYVSVNNFSVILGRLPGFHQY